VVSWNAPDGLYSPRKQPLVFTGATFAPDAE